MLASLAQMDPVPLISKRSRLPQERGGHRIAGWLQQTGHKQVTSHINSTENLDELGWTWMNLAWILHDSAGWQFLSSRMPGSKSVMRMASTKTLWRRPTIKQPCSSLVALTSAICRACQCSYHHVPSCSHLMLLILCCFHLVSFKHSLSVHGGTGVSRAAGRAAWPLWIGCRACDRGTWLPPAISASRKRSRSSSVEVFVVWSIVRVAESWSKYLTNSCIPVTQDWHPQNYFNICVQIQSLECRGKFLETALARRLGYHRKLCRLCSKFKTFRWLVDAN